MAKYLFTGSYTQTGLGGVIKEGGTKRREAVNQLVAGLGGTMETFYYALGKDDFIIIVDVPSHTEAAAASMMVNASGAVQGHITVLLTPEEIDAVAQKTVHYRPPGQ